MASANSLPVLEATPSSQQGGSGRNKYIQPSLSKSRSWTAPPLLVRCYSFLESSSEDSHSDCGQSIQSTTGSDIEQGSLSPVMRNVGPSYEDTDLTSKFSKVVSLACDPPVQSYKDELEEDDEDRPEIDRLCELTELTVSPKKRMQPCISRAGAASSAFPSPKLSSPTLPSPAFSSPTMSSPPAAGTRQKLPPPLTFCLSADDHDVEHNRIADDILRLAEERTAMANNRMLADLTPFSPVSVGGVSSLRKVPEEVQEGDMNRDSAFRKKKSIMMS